MRLTHARWFFLGGQVPQATQRESVTLPAPGKGHSAAVFGALLRDVRFWPDYDRFTPKSSRESR